jgi:hypothetical protein
MQRGEEIGGRGNMNVKAGAYCAGGRVGYLWSGSKRWIFSECWPFFYGGDRSEVYCAADRVGYLWSGPKRGSFREYFFFMELGWGQLCRPIEDPGNLSSSIFHTLFFAPSIFFVRPT